MDSRPIFPPDGFRGGVPFRAEVVHHGSGGPGALTWAIFALVLLLLLLALGSLALDAYRSRRRPGAPPAAGPPTQALAVLDDRYARGEIPRDEYLQARDDLRGATADATTQAMPPEPEPA